MVTWKKLTIKIAQKVDFYVYMQSDKQPSSDLSDWRNFVSRLREITLRKSRISRKPISFETLARCVSLAAIVSRITRRGRSIAPSKGRPLPPTFCRHDHRVIRAWRRSFIYFFFILTLSFLFFVPFVSLYVNRLLDPDLSHAINTVVIAKLAIRETITASC